MPDKPTAVTPEPWRAFLGAGSGLHRRFKVYLQAVPIGPARRGSARLIPMCADLDLRRLGVFGLEAHDLALTKLERNLDRDRQDVQALAASAFINEATLLERYAKEYRPNLASGEKKLDLTMKLWVEMCWPAN